jgi:hypothetical protein
MRKVFMASYFNVEAIPHLILRLIGSFSQGSHLAGIGDFFSRLNLDCAPPCFPNLSKEEKIMMRSILQGRSIIRVRGVEVMDALDRLLTLLFDVGTLPNPSYQCHMAIIREMAFQV